MEGEVAWPRSPDHGQAAACLRDQLPVLGQRVDKHRVYAQIGHQKLARTRVEDHHVRMGSALAHWVQAGPLVLNVTGHGAQSPVVFESQNRYRAGPVIRYQHEPFARVEFEMGRLEAAGGLCVEQRQLAGNRMAGEGRYSASRTLLETDSLIDRIEPTPVAAQDDEGRVPGAGQNARRPDSGPVERARKDPLSLAVDVGQASCVCPDDKFPGLKHVWQSVLLGSPRPRERSPASLTTPPTITTAKPAFSAGPTTLAGQLGAPPQPQRSTSTRSGQRAAVAYQASTPWPPRSKPVRCIKCSGTGSPAWPRWLSWPCWPPRAGRAGTVLPRRLRLRQLPADRPPPPPGPRLRHRPPPR
jgi:hypothetical protein